MLLIYLKALWRNWTIRLTSGAAIAITTAWVLTGNTIWPKVGYAIVLLAFFQASFSLWKSEYLRARPQTPRFDVAIVKEARQTIPHVLGATPWLWGLRIRNDGATATFQAWAEVISGATPLQRRRYPLSFTRDFSRQSTIIPGAEDQVFFALLYWNVMYGGSLSNSLWYFDEATRLDAEVPIVLSTARPDELFPEFEITIASDPPMEMPWKRHYRLGPSNLLQDITSLADAK